MAGSRDTGECVCVWVRSSTISHLSHKQKLKKGNKSIRISFIKFIPAATKHNAVDIQACFRYVRYIVHRGKALATTGLLLLFFLAFLYGLVLTGSTKDDKHYLRLCFLFPQLPRTLVSTFRLLLPLQSGLLWCNQPLYHPLTTLALMRKSLQLCLVLGAKFYIHCHQMSYHRYCLWTGSQAKSSFRFF